MTQKQRFIYTISQLTNEAKELLEGTFPLIWLEGELSNFSCPSSGHWYFTLKDSQSQVRCAMFRMRNMHTSFRPKNGDQILLRARVSLYAPRGDFQLIAEHMEEAGDGLLRKAFEALKQKLNNEGLFSTEHKQPLPPQPQNIGIITSPTGAAIKDILHILKRRSPTTKVTLYPVAVQGEQAPAQIIEMIKQATADQRCDALIVTRGGGSIEDLWAFNDEALARAIYQCPIPTISAIGHEIDYTISDFVADQRAPTPSAAAELASKDQQELIPLLKRHEQRLQHNMKRLLSAKQQQLSWLQQRIRHPQQRLLEQSQRIDELERRLIRHYQQQLAQQQQKVELLKARIQQNSPFHALKNHAQHFQALQRRLNQVIQQQLAHHQQRLSQNAHQLQAISPLATLSRGYSIAKESKRGHIIRNANQVSPGEKINLQLNKGRLDLIVEQCHED